MAELATTPAISVIVPTHNRRALMERMLHALIAQRSDTPPFELVAVADGCRDGTAAMLAAYVAPFPIAVVELPGVGPAEARNAGTKVARADLLLFLDDDVLPEPGVIAAHWAMHAGQPDGAIIGPYPPAPQAARDIFRIRSRGWWTRHFTALAQPGHRFGFRDLLTGNLSLPRRLWEELGGLDPQFARAREDLELGVRLIARGVPLRYAPDAFAWHHEHATSSLRSALRRAFEEGRSDARMLLKHPHLGHSLDIARSARRRRGRLASLVLISPRTAPLERLVPLGTLALAVLRAFGLRRGYDRLFAILHNYHYHRGAVAAVGRKWWKLADVPAAEPAPALIIDIADGLEAAERLVSASRPLSIRVLLDGAELGVLPEIPGSEPWHGRHLRTAIYDRFGPALLAPLAAELGFAPAEPPAAWRLFGEHRFDPLHAESRRQWARARL